MTKIRLNLDFDCPDFLMENVILLKKIHPNDRYVWRNTNKTKISFLKN
jgi:hypothetical protein